MAIDSKTLEDLKAKHGEIWTMTMAEQDFAFKRPDSASFERYIGTIAENRKEMVPAARRFSLDVLVYPSESEAVAFFNKYPGTPVNLAGEAALVASAKATDESRKSD